MSAQCPICSLELADVNAVRQHTRTQHSTGAAPDSSGGWTSVAGPGPEGWHPDPWNAKSKRYWDGTQWSGKTAPLDAPPESDTPEPAMAAAPAAAMTAAGTAGNLGARAAGPGDVAGAGGFAGPAEVVDRTPVDHSAGGPSAPPAGDPGSGPMTGSVFSPATDPLPPPAVGSFVLPPPPEGPLGEAPATPPLLGPPPAGPPAAGAAPKPAAPARPAGPGAMTTLAKRLPPPVWAALGAAVVVLVIVIVIAGVSSSSPNQSPLPPAGPITVAPAGPVGLAGGVLTAADVGTGWTAYPAGHPLAASAVTAAGPCHSPLWNSDTAGYEASFINGTNASAAHGAVVSQVFEANSVATASAQQQFIASNAFLPCLEQKVATEVESQFPKGAGWAITGDVANPFQLQLTNASAVGWVLMVSVRDGFGSTSVLTDDSVEIFSGLYEATLDVSWSSKAPLTQEIVQAQATTEAAHLASLPTAGTVAQTG